ncbi:MAG: sigma-54 dependent transcriptional regulator [Chloroflexota bacterium]
MPYTILILDDDNNMRWVLRRALTQAGYNVAMAATGEEGLELLSREPIDLVLLDMRMPGLDGLGVLRRFRESREDVPVILLTAYASVQTAVEAIKLGAWDYLGKPFDVDELKLLIARALEQREERAEIRRLRAQVVAEQQVGEIVGKSKAMVELLEQLPALAARPENILITGDEGTGKRLVARALWQRAAGVCAIAAELDLKLLPENLLERELFGHKVALAGVSAHREGLLERSRGGCVLLSNLHRLGAAGQEHLAGLLTTLRIRVVATASSPLAPALMQSLSAIELQMPSLRERREDIHLLVRHFAGGRECTALALQALESYHWPGNVAELKRVAERAAVLAEGPIDLEHLPPEVAYGLSGAAKVPFRLPPGGIALEEVEKELVRQALELAHGNKTQAARLLGLTRHTLLYRLQKYGLAG